MQHKKEFVPERLQLGFLSVLQGPTAAEYTLVQTAAVNPHTCTIRGGFIHSNKVPCTSSFCQLHTTLNKQVSVLKDACPQRRTRVRGPRQQR